MSKLENMFKLHSGIELPKVDLTYELLNQLDANPHAKLLDARRIDVVKMFASAIVKRFEDMNQTAKGGPFRPA